MSSHAYLYSLLENEGVVRRDLPAASPAPNLALMATEVEQEAFEARARASARNLLFLEALQPPRPQQPSLVSSSEGQIKAMLLTIPFGTTVGDFEAIYRRLFESLPDYTRFICLVNTDTKATVEQWLSEYSHSQTPIVIEAPNYVGFSIWAQDAYAVCSTSDEKIYIIEPLSFLRYADAVIADFVAAATDIDGFQVPLYFQGGNILIGDDFWLIGIDYPTNTLNYIHDAIFPDPGETPQALVRRLFQENLDVSRELIYVGSPTPVPTQDVVLVMEEGKYFVDMVFQGNKDGTAQPMFHIDMFMTLAGRNTEGKYRILVGDPSLAPPAPSELTATYSMQIVYDAIARVLPSDRFEVIRNPLPLTYASRKISVEALNRPQDRKLYEIYLALRNAGLTEVDLRSWYFATANNALVEITSAARRVWLPTYGYDDYSYLEESDNRNREIWENMGFEVTLLPNFHRLARGLGAVHCIQKYIERG